MIILFHFIMNKTIYTVFFAQNNQLKLCLRGLNAKRIFCSQEASIKWWYLIFFKGIILFFLFIYIIKIAHIKTWKEILP